MSGIEGIDGPPRWREGDPVWVTFGPDAEPQRAWVRESGSLFMDHVPVRIEEGNQDAVVRSDHVARRFAAPQPERRPNVFKAEARFLLSGAEMEEIIFEVAGAASGVFLSEDPHKVMPTAEITKAVHDWYAATEGTFTEAEARAQLDLLARRKGSNPEDRRKARLLRAAAELESDPEVKRALFDAAYYFSNRGAGVVILMRPRDRYADRELNERAVVIDSDGTIIKNRGGIGGVAAGRELLESATPLYPESMWHSGDVGQFLGPDPLPEVGDGDRSGWSGLLDKPDPALVPIPDEFPSFEGSEQVKAWADSNVALASVFTRRMIEAGVHSPQEARVWGQAADMLSAEFERLAPQEWKDEATAAGFPPVEPGPPEPPVPPPDRWNPGQDSYYGYGWEDLTPVQKWSLGLILAVAAVAAVLTVFGK